MSRASAVATREPTQTERADRAAVAASDPVPRQAPSRAHQLLCLQRTVGNRATGQIAGPARRSRLLQRSPEDVSVPVAVYFDQPLDGAGFRRVAAAQLKLDPGKIKWSGVKDSYAPGDSPVTVLVSASLMKRARSDAAAADLGLGVDAAGKLAGADDRADAMSRLSDAERARLNDEIDRRYWKATGIPSGQKIKSRSGERGNVAMWEQVRDEVLAQRAFIADLPEKARQVLHYSNDGVVIRPEQYEQVVRIARKLEGMDPGDIENYLRRVKPTTDLDALEKAVESFLATKAAAPEKLKEVLEKTDEGKWDVDSAASALDADTMFYLSLADRVRVIKEIADGTIVGNDDEKTIIRLLTSTPSTDRSGLLGALKANESALLKQLDSVIDGEENKLYYVALRNLVFATLTPAEAQASMVNARILPWSDPGLIKASYTVRIKYDTVEFTGDGRVHVSYYMNIAFMGMKTQDQYFAPDEIIGLRFLSDEDWAGASEGEMIFMPAANMLAFEHEQFSRELGLVVDIGLLFAGGMGIVAKGTRLAKAIAVLDTAMAVAAITINSFRSDIAKTESGKTFLRAWDTVNTLIAVYGLARLVVTLPKTFRDLRAAYREFKAAGANEIAPDALSKLDSEAAKLLDKADEAIAESEVAALRNKHTPEQLSAYEPQLAKAGGITDEAKRQAALADIERQMASQQENLALIDELKKANPKMTNKEIADLAAPRIKVPTVPHGMDAEEFQRAQEFIKKFLQDRGIKDAEGFATGSRITGVTFNPKKPAFGQASSSFAKKDFDITIITSPTRPLTKGEIKKLQDAYAAEFKHPLGVRAVSDTRQLGFIPVYGKLDLVLK